MLVFKSKIAIVAIAFLFGTMITGLSSSDAQQQTPSQRYQPTRDYSAQSTPPSVHVPPQHSRPIATANGGASYRFSDTQPLRGGSDQPHEQGTVMQTSYQVDANGEPVVPDILAGAQGQSQPAQTIKQSAFGGQGTAPQITAEAIPVKTPQRTPAEFAAQMNQIRSSSPRIAPQEFSAMETEHEAAREEIATFHQTVQQQRQQKAQSTRPVTQPVTPRSEHTTTPVTIETEVVATNIEPAMTQTEALAVQEPVVEELEVEEQLSATEFISRLNVEKNESGSAPMQDSNTAPQTAFQSDGRSISPATMHVPQNFDTVNDNNVVPVSAETEILEASIKLAMPAITVETFGPQTVGINKPATYKVVVKNDGQQKAEQILIGVNLPTWVDLENINMTTGSKQVTDGKEQARLIWSVDKVPGNSTQTITITAVPRKPEMFDMSVEWTVVPRIGAANIQVTEPKLEMNIVGPGDVLYGEQALYHVTVRNPGTGAAENVTVMLPEALGGERASLGNILPGTDKNFQVELLARTAGELNLVATAVADGDLQVSADRKLTVRRANLGITINGPGLKYAGSVGQYQISIKNNGDATANEIEAAMALPTGVKFLSGIDTAKTIEGGLRWQVGSLEPGQAREFKVNCQLDTSGDLQLEVGAQSKGDLQAASACLTRVETVADLVLTVHDPKGPLPTGQETVYEINIRNRGSRAAKGVDLVMQFSEGIEPKKAAGMEHKIVPGQVVFSPIENIDPGQEMTFKVSAEALKGGTHIFRAQLICKESDSREIAEGTTRFFGDEIQRSPSDNTANRESTFGGSDDFSNGFQR